MISGPLLTRIDYDNQYYKPVDLSEKLINRYLYWSGFQRIGLIERKRIESSKLIDNTIFFEKLICN